MEVVIFGLGGGGSHLAYMVSRHPEVNILHLVDFDVVETKNLSRQLYDKTDVGKFKANALAERLKLMSIREDLIIIPHVMKIESKLELSIFNPKIYAFIETDNLQSKKLISSYFRDFVISGNDVNSFEITHDPHSYDDTWVIGQGYSSEQTFLANIVCTTYLFLHWVKKNREEVRIRNLEELL